MVTDFCKKFFKIFIVIFFVISNSIVLFGQSQAPIVPNVSFAQMPTAQDLPTSPDVGQQAVDQVQTGQALAQQAAQQQVVPQPAASQSASQQPVSQQNDAGIPTVAPQNALPAIGQQQLPVSQAPVSQNMPSGVVVQSQDQSKTSMIDNIVGGEVIKPKNDNEIVDEGQDADIYLNFDNASLGSIVNYIGEQKKINIIPHKDLAAANVTMSTRNGLTLNRAWNVVLTLLEMNGFSMIKVGKVYRVVSSKDNRYEPLPVYSSGTGTEPEDLPQSDMVVRYIYLFKNIKAELARDILGSMLDKDGILISGDLNACIIKEKCFNIKAAMKIVKQLDTGGLSEQIKIIPLRYANSDDVSTLFQGIMQSASGGKDERIIRFTDKDSKKEGAYFSASTKIFSDPTKNRLILLGTQKNLDKITDFIYKHIDVPIGGAESRLHVKEIRYAKAEDLKPILTEIIAPPKGQGSDKSVLVGEYKFFEDVIISAEKATSADDATSTRGGGNRLIVSCNRDDWKRLEKIIAKLDKPQPQIAFEVMIIDVEVNKEKQLAAQMYQIFGHKLGMGQSIFQTMNLSDAAFINPTATTPVNYMEIPTDADQGNDNPTFVTLGKAATQTNPSQNIWSVIKALVNSNNTNIIAQPFMVSNNNQPCRVEVASSYRVNGELDSRKGEPSKLKLVDVTAAIVVEITPKMNLVGVVDLDIKVTVDSFISPPQNGNKLNRALKTKASMLAGEVLVLGGLTKRSDDETTYKTPILGDIPLIGSIFFKNKDKTLTESNLYIFIRPSVIKPRFEGAADEYTQLKLDYAKYQLLKNDTFLENKDPIQRWFFKPADQSIKQKLSDVKKGVIRPLDDFVFAKSMPRMVNIKGDSYYKVSEELARYEEKEKRKRAKEQTEEVVTGTVTLN